MKPTNAYVVSPFFTKEGKNLLVNGLQTRITGYNYIWLGYGCTLPTDSELDQVFTQMKNASKTVAVRSGFYQSGSNNGTFTDFDRYIAAAKRNGIYLIPMLVNEWKDCEPQGIMKYLPWYQSGYKNIDNGHTLSFKDYAVSLVKKYANEPTIAWWQLVNEPDARNSDGSCNEVAAATAITAFAKDVATAVKLADPNHLVELGAVSWCGSLGNDLALVHQDSSLDLIDVHHDYDQATVAYPTELQRRIGVISLLDKPVYMAESGICADVSSSGRCTGTVNSSSLNLRASFMDSKMNAVFNTADLVGYLIWHKGISDSSFNIRDGDPTETIVSKYFWQGLPTTSTPTPTSPQLTKLIVYEDVLNLNWADWSWDATVNLQSASPTYSGTKSTAVTFTAGWGALRFHTDSAVDTTPYTYLHFAMYGSKVGQQFGVNLIDTNNASLPGVNLTNYGGSPPVGAWKAYNVPLSDLGGANTLIKDIVIQEWTGTSQPTIYIDEVNFTTNTLTVTPQPTTTLVPSDTTPPTILFTYPTNGAILKRGSTIILAASSSDNIGVKKVEFYLEGSKLLCTDTSPDYTCSWKAPNKPGAIYTLMAKSTDIAGNNSSVSIKITLSK